LVILTSDKNGMEMCSVTAVAGMFGEREVTASEEKRKYKKSRWK